MNISETKECIRDLAMARVHLDGAIELLRELGYRLCTQRITDAQQEIVTVMTSLQESLINQN